MSLPFPNVPFAPGVPNVPRSATNPVSDNVSIGDQAVTGSLWESAQSTVSWAILDSSGNSAIDADSFVNFGNPKDSDIPNFPIEQGSFATYNKVILPYTITIRLTKGGTQTDRTQFLMDVEALYQSVDLYTILTPELSYENMNLQRYEVQRRGANGAFWLSEVDLTFIQIDNEQQQYTNTSTTTQDAQNPSAQGVDNVGTVQPGTPSPQASAAVSNGLANTSGY
jgi:hypothetical protein